jgi:hypothetical protein
MKNYVKVFNGHKVPEGATHYDIKFRLPYYSIISGQETKFYRDDFSKWVKSENGNDWHNEKLIELPEAKWEPVVGEECEYSQSPINAKCKNWHKDIFIYKHGDLVWLSGGGIITTKNLNFRPLSSVEELEREEFIRLALYHCYNGLESGNMAAAMFDVGFTAPKELK